MTGPQVRNSPHLDTDDVMSEPDDFNHYANKSAITLSIVTGIPVETLCGVRFVPQSHGDGVTWSRDLADCPLCGIVYAGLPA